MGIRKIVTLGDETLRKECKPQAKFDLRLALLLKDMADTMYKADGVGLAAPQVGILRRVVVIDEIIAADGSQTGREGCLSLPGRQAIVTRPMKVKARYQNRKGEWMEIETEGLEARAICHELDHLDGRLYIDVMDRELSKEEIEGHVPEDDPE